MLAVTESWIYEDSPDVHKKDAAPEGLSIVHAHRTVSAGHEGKTRGGGIALIHRRDIKVKVIPTPTALSFHSFEVLIAKIVSSNTSLTIAIVYRPPGSASSQSAFTTDLSDLIDSGELGPRYIICGDLNCPGPAGTRGLVGKDLAELIESYSLTQHIDCPTHQSGNILDHILSSNEVTSLRDVVVNDVGISDHYLASCKIDVSNIRQPIVTSIFRNWKKLDLDLFRKQVRSSSAFLM